MRIPLIPVLRCRDTTRTTDARGVNAFWCKGPRVPYAFRRNGLNLLATLSAPGQGIFTIPGGSLYFSVSNDTLYYNGGSYAL